MEGIWTGSDYELTIEFAHKKQMEKAFARLMREPALTNLWMDQQRTVPFRTPLFEESPVTIVFGALETWPEVFFPCRISALALGNLTISIPQNAFAEHFAYTYPLTLENNPWLAKINDCFIRLATSIYKAVPFLSAAIGEEIAGDITVSNLFEKDLLNVLMIVPESLLQSVSTKPRHKWVQLLL
ncbi:MAG: hypothetical protein ABS949_08280 [Solibacillus sp.]